METTYMSIDGYVNQEDVMYIHSGILLIHKNEWSNASWSNMDGPRDYHTKWSKSGRKRQIPYASTHSQSKTWHRVTGAGLPWRWWQRRGWRHRSSSACKAFGLCKAGGSSSEEADNQCRLGLGCRGAFEKGERAEEKRSFRARARELQLAALKKHHENEISHHAKETECLKRETERHKRSIKKPDVVMTVVKCTQFSVEWLPIIAHFCVDYV